MSYWIRFRWSSYVYVRVVSRGLGRASPTTVYRFFKDERVQTCTAAKLFDNLGISDIRPYQLHAGGAHTVNRNAKPAVSEATC